jgi:hypothetical protein
MTPKKIAELKRLAKDATPGPWYFDESCDIWAGPFDPETMEPKHAIVRMHYNPAYHPNLKYIAACNPQAIIELCDELELYRKALKKIAKSDGGFNHSGDYCMDMARKALMEKTDE